MNYIVTRELNIRSGPGTDYDVIGTLEKGQIVVVPVTNGWVPIVLEDGSFGWASLKYLAVAPEPSPTPSPVVTGKDFLDLAATRIGEEYVYGADVPLDDEDYHGPWDCAEFVTWVVNQLTGELHGCVDNDAVNPDPYTGGWKQEVLKQQVKSIPISQAFKTPGAILLRYRSTAKHIVFSDGLGGTIEAKGAAYGVCAGKLTSPLDWDYGILIPGVQY